MLAVVLLLHEAYPNGITTALERFYIGKGGDGIALFFPRLPSFNLVAVLDVLNGHASLA